MHRRSGGFICVNLAWTIASVATSSPTAAQGSLRQLVCRGKAGIALRVHRDPSPRDNSRKQVEMVLEYTRPGAKPGDEYNNLQPGECFDRRTDSSSCSWCMARSR